MMYEELNDIAVSHDRNMRSMGWSDPSKSNEHYLMLVIGEVCEAVQAHRKGNIYFSHIGGDMDVKAYVDNRESPDALFKETFEYYCKDTVADEMADTLLRLLSLYWMRGYDGNHIRKAVNTGVTVPDGTFTERSYSLCRMLYACREEEQTPVLLSKSIAYVISWCESMDIVIHEACHRKMRYNLIRNDWKNKEKSY